MALWLSHNIDCVNCAYGASASFFFLCFVIGASYASDMQLTEVPHEFVSNCKNKSEGTSEVGAIFALSPNMSVKKGQTY